MIYESSNLVMRADGVEDPLGRITLDDLPDRPAPVDGDLVGATPLVERLWRCAHFDFASNRCVRSEGKYLAAGGRGKGWNGMVYTRDLAYAGLLGLDDCYPHDMRSCLEVTRRVRLDLGLQVDREHTHPDLPFIEVDIDANTFTQHYGTNPYARRTDDVVWLWWAADLFTKHFDAEQDWRWVYETGQRCFRELYDPLFDQQVGLYRGQPSFVDIGASGYPQAFGRKTRQARRNAIMIYATSTNALYVRGLQVMADAATRIGQAQAASRWQARADALRDAVAGQLRFEDGTLAYFRHEDGQLEPRQHALATALCILCEVLRGDEAARAIEAYPIRWWGAPLFAPFYPGDECYHNNSAWPFVDALLLRAREQALGVDETRHELALLVRTCRGDTFHEWTNALTGEPSGKEAQLWTLAPFLGRCAIAGWVRRR